MSARLAEVIRKAIKDAGWQVGYGFDKLGSQQSADFIAAAVAAHLASPEVVERAYRAFTLEILRQDGQSYVDLDAKLKATSPADLRKIEATMRAALAAAVGGEARDG